MMKKISKHAQTDGFSTFFEELEEQKNKKRAGGKWAFEVSAAVLVYYNIDTIEPAFDVDIENRAEIIEMLIDQSITVKDESGKSQQMFVDRYRRRVIRQCSIAQLREALARNPERSGDFFQSVMDTYVSGQSIDLKSKNYQELQDISHVVNWLSSQVAGLPSLSELNRAFRIAAFFERHQLLAGKNFYGRKNELSQLREYIGVLPPESITRGLIRTTRKIFNYDYHSPLVISGPGGIGKSTLLSRLILEHVKSGKDKNFPFAYLDFERTELLAHDPLSLLTEIVTQISIQYPVVSKELQVLTGRLKRRMASLSYRLEENNISHNSKDFDSLIDISNSISQFVNIIDTDLRKEQPFVLFVDTLERVQYKGDYLLDCLWAFFDVLRKSFSKLRVVIAGRAPIENDKLKTENLILSDFGESAAVDYLKTILKNEKAHNRGYLKQIYSQVGGNPLSLKLAANVINKQKDGANLLDDVGGNSFFRWMYLKDEIIQGQLYRRILEHISNSDIKKLAHPGLILRRISPEIILDVLSKPCGVLVKNIGEAEKLFESFRKEVGLVGLTDDGALYHRPEIRSTMLRDLIREKNDLANIIQKKAIAFYSKKSDEASGNPKLTFRAEEIYHRLLMSHSYSEIDKRWLKGVERKLSSSLSDFPLPSKAYLAEKLGVTLPGDELKNANLELWEKATSRKALSALRSGNIRKAKKLLSERNERTLNSPLFAIEARQFIMENNYAKALKIVEIGIKKTSIVADKDNMLRLQLLRGEIATALNMHALQFESARNALHLAKLQRDHVAILISGIALLNSNEHSLETKKIYPIDHDIRAKNLVDDTLDMELFKAFNNFSGRELTVNRSVVADYALQIGNNRPSVLSRVIRSIDSNLLDKEDVLSSVINLAKSFPQIERDTNLFSSILDVAALFANSISKENHIKNENFKSFETPLLDFQKLGQVISDSLDEDSPVRDEAVPVAMDLIQNYSKQW